MERNCFRCEVRGKRKFLWHWPQLSLNMVSLSLNSLKQIMKAMVDHQGFDKVLRKVRLSHSETLFDAFNIYFCDREHRGTARLPGRDVTQVHCWQVATYAPPLPGGRLVCHSRQGGVWNAGGGGAHQPGRDAARRVDSHSGRCHIHHGHHVHGEGSAGGQRGHEHNVSPATRSTLKSSSP